MVEGDQFRFEEPTAAPAAVTFRCATGALALLASGRIPAAQAISSGRLAVEGDASLAEQFSQWFKGI